MQTVFRRCKRNEGLRNNKFRDRITIIALCIRVEELSLIAMHLYFTAQFETTKVNSLSGNQEIPSLYILLIKLIYLISLFSHTFVTPLQENNTLQLGILKRLENKSWNNSIEVTRNPFSFYTLET